MFSNIFQHFTNTLIKKSTDKFPQKYLKFYCAAVKIFIAILRNISHLVCEFYFILIVNKTIIVKM